MTHSIFSLISILAVTFTTSHVLAQKPNLPPSPEVLDKIRNREVVTAVPGIIRDDIYKKACNFLQDVYPDIDREWMEKECGGAILKDRYGLVLRGAPAIRVNKRGVVEMELAFPSCQSIMMDARQPPPGVMLDRLKKPLTLEEAELRARRVLARLAGAAEDARQFTVTRSGEAQANYDSFDFTKYAPSRHYPAAFLSVKVRRSDGLVTMCEWWSIAGLRPNCPYEKAAEMARAAGTGNHGSLQMHYWGGIGTLTWDFCTPPKPGGSMPQDYTWWDAMTGEVVYSQVIHGGTPEKPYKNPKYFIEVTDDVIKRNIEKLIKDRVAELEKREK